MGGLSVWHWLIFLAVALLLFGGSGKISSIMGDVAKGIKSFKKGMSEDDETAKTATSRQEGRAARPSRAPRSQARATATPRSPARPAEPQGLSSAPARRRQIGRARRRVGRRRGPFAQLTRNRVEPMFDITSSKLLILGIVALLVIGPKDLPALLRTIGKYVGIIKRHADGVPRPVRRGHARERAGRSSRRTSRRSAARRRPPSARPSSRWSSSSTRRARRRCVDRRRHQAAGARSAGRTTPTACRSRRRHAGDRDASCAQRVGAAGSEAPAAAAAEPRPGAADEPAAARPRRRGA